MPLYLKYFIAWFLMLIIAIINGTIRDFIYKNRVGELRAHQISTGTLIIFFSLYIRFIVNRYPPASGTQAMTLGLFWMALTLLFEFGFGRYRGHSWGKLLRDYNLLEGRLWVLIPLWIAIAPYAFYYLKQLK